MRYDIFQILKLWFPVFKKKTKTKNLSWLGSHFKWRYIQVYPIYMYVHSMSENIKSICRSFRNRQKSESFLSECKWILIFTNNTRILFLPRFQQYKKVQNNCQILQKKAETSVVHCFFLVPSITYVLYFYHFLPLALHESGTMRLLIDE